MALAERAELVARLSLKDDFSAKVRGAERAVKGLDKAFSRTQSSLARTGQNIGRLGVLAAGAAAGGLVAVVKVAADFESQLNTINTIARATPEQLGKIGDSIRQIARDTGTPLADLTQGYYDLLSAGVEAADAAGVLTAANTLAIGGLSTTADAVDLLTTAINVYGGDATKAAGYADIFAKAVERGKVTADEIAGSFSQVGNIAASSGLEIEEIAAAFARLTAGGTDAAEVTTQMRSAIVALTKRTPDLEKLEKATRKNYLALAGSKGLVVALEEMRVDAKKAGIPLIDLLGRVEGLNFTLATTGPNFAAYSADLDAMGDAAGTAAEQMGERQKGLNFVLGRLKALATDAGITIGSALLPKLVPLVERLNAFIGDNQGQIASIGATLARGFEDFADAIGKVDWQPFIDGLTITGGIAKEAIRLFMSLPPDVQKIAIAALAVNKVTGGLGTSLIKDLAGLALGSLRTITAANVTVIGGRVGGGGIPGGTAAGGAAGGLGRVGNAVRILGTVALAAGSVALIGELLDQKRQQTEANEAAGKALVSQTTAFGQTASLEDMRRSLAGIQTYTHDLQWGLTPEAIAYQLNIDGVKDAVNASKAALERSIAAAEATIARSKGLSPEDRDVLSQQRRATDRVYDAIERNRIARQAINVTVNVSTSVSVRDQALKSRIAAKYGMVAS